MGTALLTLGALIQRNAGWSVALGLAGILGYLLIRHRDPVLLAVWAGNALLLVWRHRLDLASPPVLRDWLRHDAGRQGGV